MKILEYTMGLYKVSTLPWHYYRLKSGGKKLRRWVKKNLKHPDDMKHNYNDMFELSYKRAKKLTKALNIEIDFIGKDTFPKGALWITPNHTSMYDPLIMMAALGKKHDLSFVGKKELEDKKWIKGYVDGLEMYMIERDKPKQSLKTLNAAASWSKTFSRAMVIFPEGTRSYTGEPLPYLGGTYKIAQKFFLNIQPMTIMGTELISSPWQVGKKKIILKSHTVIKPLKVMHMKPQILADNIRKQTWKDVQDWRASLRNEDKVKFEKNLPELQKKREERSRKV